MVSIPVRMKKDAEDVENLGKDLAKEQITVAIGEFGKWQFLKCFFIVSIIWTAASFHLLTSVFFT